MTTNKVVDRKTENGKKEEEVKK